MGILSPEIVEYIPAVNFSNKVNLILEKNIIDKK